MHGLISYSCGSFSGCNKTEHPEAGCPDLSDVKICKNQDVPEYRRVCDEKIYFDCGDNKTCIPNSLICDGYGQCPNSTDEKQCEFCPRPYGHPPRPETEQLLNTYHCIHRYTHRPICAIPCDGRDDLCENFEDESGCDGTYFLYILMAAIILIGALTMALFLLDRKFEFLNLKQQNKKGNRNVYEMGDMQPDSNLTKTRYLQILANVILCIKVRHLPGLKEMCLNIYQLINHSYTHLSLLHTCTTKEGERIITVSNELLFWHMGTFHTTMSIFDCVDNSIFFHFKNYLLKNFSIIKMLARNGIVDVIFRVMSYFIMVLFYYLDLIKDVVFLVILYQFLPTNVTFEGLARESRKSYQVQMTFFSAAVTFLLLGEFSNVLLFLQEPWSVGEKVVGCFLFPLIPAAIMYKHAWHKFKLFVMAQKGTESTKISEVSSKSEYFEGLRAKLRVNENSLEHMSQIVLLTLLFLLKDSQTASTPVNFANGLLSDKELFGIPSNILFGLSLFASIFSSVRGQLGLTVVQKNGFVGFVAKVALFAYYTIGTVARLIAFVLLFTPALGLFNTLHHTQFTSSDVTKTVINYYVINNKIYHPYVVYDIYSNETVMNFGDKWEHYKLMGSKNFYSFDSRLVVAFVPVMLIVHLCLSVLLQDKLYYKGSKERMSVSLGKKTLEGLSTWVCPPLHLDWEMLLRLFKGHVSIAECWRRAKRLQICFHFILFFEHLLMLVPLIALKIAIEGRNTYLAENNFTLSEGEEYSTWVVNTLLFSGIATFIALPLTTLGLAYLYFAKKHPWSRFLKDSWSEDPSEEVISQTELTKESVLLALSSADQTVKEKGHTDDKAMSELIVLLQRIVREMEAIDPKTESDN